MTRGASARPHLSHGPRLHPHSPPLSQAWAGADVSGGQAVGPPAPMTQGLRVTQSKGCEAWPEWLTQSKTDLKTV